MPLQNNETYQQYRERVINPISPSFCGAKWFNATIWLGSGTTASCHHPPAHKIPVEEVTSNYKAIHNTSYKKLVREQMLRGERPVECEYCWKIEDLGADKVSDRVYKSVIYTDDDLITAQREIGSVGDAELQTLEIAFDANCNFACSYCNPSFSTSWMTDIRTNGPYQNMVSDGAGAFQQDGSWAQPYGVKNENNPYVDAFMQWWEKELQFTLKELRITGGEATMSQDFWKLMDWWKDHPDCKVQLAVNSNLGALPRLIDRLCETSKSFNKFHLYTSNESFGTQAEYIRDGLVWDDWIANIHKMLSQGNVTQLHVMMTINALCLSSITKFMDEMLVLKRTYGTHHAIMSFNILRFPSFQSIVTLPKEIRLKYAEELEQWLQTNWYTQVETQRGRGVLHRMEYDGIVRTIAYIREIDEGHYNTSSMASRQRDFKSFYTQYDTRRGKEFASTFPDLAQWFKDIPVTKTIPITLVDGDSTKGWKHVSELQQRAIEEGWVITPSQSNPVSQTYSPPKIAS